MADVVPEQTRIEILNHTKTVERLHQLIQHAERHLVLVSPYVSIDKLRALVRELQAALARKVQVKLVLREKDVSTGQSDPLASEALQALRTAGMEVRLLKDLHAKVYLSEKHALLTSLNLLESSINNSIEVSAWLTAGTPEYRQLVEVLRTGVYPTSVKVEALPPVAPPARDARPLPTAEREGRRRTRAERNVTPVFDDQEGHCLRCGNDIAFDADKPLCPDCFGVWRRYGDPNYTEEYCHSCGEESDTSGANPLFYDCFRNG